MASTKPPLPAAAVVASSSAVAGVVLLVVSGLNLFQMLVCSAVLWFLFLEIRGDLPSAEDRRRRSDRSKKTKTRKELIEDGRLVRPDDDDDTSKATTDDDDGANSLEMEDEVFEDVKPLKEKNGGLGLNNKVVDFSSRKNVRATSEELVRQLQEMERRTRQYDGGQGSSRSPMQRLVMLEESLSSFHSIDEAEEEDEEDEEEQEEFKDVKDLDSTSGTLTPSNSVKRRNSSKKLKRRSSRSGAAASAVSNGASLPGEVMVYDTSRRVALVFHAGEATSYMVGQTAKDLLEKMSFKVNMVKCSEEGGEAMIRSACEMIRSNSAKARKSDCLLIAFLPTLKFSQSFEEFSRHSSISISRSSSMTSLAQLEEEETDLFSVLGSTRSLRARPTLIFDFRQEDKLSPNTTLPEHCLLAVGHSRRTTQPIWRNVSDRLQSVVMELQQDLRHLSSKKQRRLRSTLKYPMIICQKPCDRHRPECPY